MTIKMDRVVCLTLPRSLVCNHEAAEDVFLVGGCLGCRERKPGQLAPVNGVYLYGCVGAPSRNPWQEISRASGQEVWFSCTSLLASPSFLHSALPFLPLTRLSSHPWPLALWAQGSELPQAAALDLL